MKLKRVLFMILFCLGLASCDFVVEPKGAEKNSVDQKGMQINPKSIVGYVGDVMPFYEDGEMNIFYLQDGRNTYLGYHPFALMTTKDFVNYKDYGEVIPYENDLYSQDMALGTGSVIKDKNGIYHCFYTGHNDYKNNGLPWFEKIQHATSLDKINWKKIEADGFYGGCNDFRDPYVYFEEKENTYYMLITTRVNDYGVIKQYKSKDLTKWTDNGIFFKNDAGSYNMECPTYLYYNGYYYLSYSEQGAHRVTHYRYKKNLADPWIKPEIDYFDGEGFYAGRMEKGFDKLYVFGWCGTKEGDWDNGAFNWAGNLVTHELVQQENGELKPKMVQEFKDTFHTKVDYKLKNKESLSAMTFDKSSSKAFAVEELAENITRFEFDAEIKELEGNFGLSFNTLTNHVLSELILSFDLKKNQISFHNQAKSFSDFGSAQIVVPYTFKTNTTIHVDAIIDGQILTIYVQDEIALSTRMYAMPKTGFSFFGYKANISLKDVSFYE
ncbi:MAG: DUF4975 domain-containing protein [Acholeplasmatales bacterium]|nr:DUF4975 domain-containing protein [Acholeplasmatales bacterium]